jgi:hypothetical protein
MFDRLRRWFESMKTPKGGKVEMPHLVAGD